MSDETLALISSYGPIVVMVLVFYFLLYRPQKAEQKKRNEMLNNLHKGNKIMNVGGIYGEIVDIDDNILYIKIADRVIIKASRGCVNTNVTQGLNPKGENNELVPEEKEKK